MTRKVEFTGNDPLIDCELPLGQAELLVHNELALNGWAASPRQISGVAVQIGERQWNAAYGLDTPSLAKRLPGVTGVDRAGYSLVIDTSRWEPGAHFVTVAAFDREGGRAAVEGAIEIRPFVSASQPPPKGPAVPMREDVVLSLDSPAIEGGAAFVEGPLDVHGWAFAKEGIEAVLVGLDGAIRYEALRPIARPDLLRELGWEIASEAGFALRIDPADCPPGNHKLTVSAMSRDGRVAGVECDLECRATPGLNVLANPATIEPATHRPAAALNVDDELAGAEGMWEGRALAAESDAALSRAEARLAKAGEVRARRELREALGRLS